MVNVVIFFFCTDQYRPKCTRTSGKFLSIDICQDSMDKESASRQRSTYTRQKNTGKKIHTYMNTQSSEPTTMCPSTKGHHKSSSAYPPLIRTYFYHGTLKIWEPRQHSGKGATVQIGRSLVRFQIVSLGFFIDIKSFRSHYGPEIDSASNINEYQEYFLGGKKRPVLMTDNLTTILGQCYVIREP